jgi:hypothetical protein
MFNILVYLSVIPWLLGMLCFRVAYLLVILANYISPNSVSPNCWVHAAREFHRAQKQWDNITYDKQPYVALRTSRKKPHWVFHVLNCEHVDAASGMLPVTSFSPIEPKDAKIWNLPARIRFAAQIKLGDKEP